MSTSVGRYSNTRLLVVGVCIVLAIGAGVTVSLLKINNYVDSLPVSNSTLAKMVSLKDMLPLDAQMAFISEFEDANKDGVINTAEAEYLTNMQGSLIEQILKEDLVSPSVDLEMLDAGDLGF